MVVEPADDEFDFEMETPRCYFMPCCDSLVDITGEPPTRCEKCDRNDIEIVEWDEEAIEFVVVNGKELFSIKTPHGIQYYHGSLLLFSEHTHEIEAIEYISKNHARIKDKAK